MKKKTRPTRIRSRSSGGQPWSTKDENQLLRLVREGREWSDIAAALNRTYSGVQGRFQILRRCDVRAAAIVPKKRTRAERPELVADFTCGAVSKAGRRVLDLARSAIGLPASNPSVPLDEWNLVLCAIIRELLLSSLRADKGGLRITISKIRTKKVGLGQDALRGMIASMVNAALVVRFVGYPDAISFSERSARMGRLLLLRASSRLIDFCHQNGISAANLFTHFPTLQE